MPPITRANARSKMVCYELTKLQMRTCRQCAIEVTEQRAKWSKGRGSQWHKGQFDTPDVSTRIGFFGEIALYEILRVWFPKMRYPDIQVRRKVQRYDFDWNTPAGSKHEVKTTVAAPDADANYVRESAVENADVFWFMATEDPDCGIVFLRGWCTRSELLDLGLVKHGKGNWKNYVMETELLRQLPDFLEFRNKRDS